MQPWQIQNFGITESWHIQNQKHIQNPGNPKLWYIQNQRHVKNSELFKRWIFRIPPSYLNPANSYNCFCKLKLFRNISISYPLVHEINMIFLIQVPEKSLFNVKSTGGNVARPGNVNLIYLFEVLQ